MIASALSPEALAAIVFGILQVGVGLAALWQQRQLRLIQGQGSTSIFAYRY